MLKKKTLKQFLFATLMCVSAVLLCFGGVYALNNAYNLKTNGNVDPDIICKIQYVVGDNDNPTFDENSKIIFDNSTSSTTGTEEDDPNPLDKITIKNTSNIADKITFNLINFNTDKHIRLSFKDVKVSTADYPYASIPQICCDAASSSSNPSSTTGSWTISANAEISFNVVVEEVHKVTINGNDLADTTPQYFANNETPTVNLVPNIGFQLPQTVALGTGATATETETGYSVSNNLQGTLKLNKLSSDASITCNCERVFTIHENSATPMFAANGNQNTIGDCGYLPNNGYYTYTATPTPSYTRSTETEEVYIESTKIFNPNSTNCTVQRYYYDPQNPTTEILFTKTGDTSYTDVPFGEQQSGTTYYHLYTISKFKEYKYFVEMGYYPQTMEFSFPTTGANAQNVGANQITGNNKKYTRTDTSSYNHPYFNPATNVGALYWYTDGTDYYVCSQIIMNTGNTVGLGDNVSNNMYGMFKLEPIVWIVVGAKNGTTPVELETLHYQNNMFFTDAACGKPFTGQLVLLSAYGLDSSVYNTSSTTTQYSASEIMNTLTTSGDFFNKNTQALNTTNKLFDFGGKHIEQQSITTYEIATPTMVTVSDNPLFLLGYGTDGENYKYSDYFKSEVPEKDTKNKTYSLAVTSLSDFAIAHNAECGSHTQKVEGADDYFKLEFAVKMGWSSSRYDTGTKDGQGHTVYANTTTPTTDSSCAYWLRTAREKFDGKTAYVINLNGVPVSTSTTDDNICIRPCTVIDLSYYYNKDNSTTPPTDNHKFYENDYVISSIVIENPQSPYITTNTTGQTTTYSLPTPQKTGYTFDGWFTADGTQITGGDGILEPNVQIDETAGTDTTNYYTNGNGEWICSTPTTLYARWTPTPLPTE